MLTYSKSDFLEVNIKKDAATVASQFHNALKKYWNKVPEHPLYSDKVPIDSGYCDANIAILRYFLEHEIYKPSKACEFYIQRILVYFELDPPSEFIDKKGSVLNQFSKKDQESLDDGVIFGRELIATLDEMIKRLNGSNKARESHFNLTADSQERKKYYDSLVFVRMRNTQTFIIDAKRKLILRYSNEQQKNLKDIFLAIADSYLYNLDPDFSEFSPLTKQQCDHFIEEIENNKLNINDSHPLLRQTALCFAVECEAKEAIESLISRANINWPDETGRCSVHYAAKMGNYPIFELLVNASVNLKVIDRDDWSPLHYAVWYLHEVNKIDSTSKHKKQDRIEILDLILAKCDLMLLLHRDRMGRTAFHYAKALKLDDDIVNKLYNRLAQLAQGSANEIKAKLVDNAGYLPEKLKSVIYVYGDSKLMLASSEHKQDSSNKLNASSAPINIPKISPEKDNIQTTNEQDSVSNKTTVSSVTNPYHQPAPSSKSLQEFSSVNSHPNSMSSFSGAHFSDMGSFSLQYRELEQNCKRLMQVNDNLKQENNRLNREIIAERKDAKNIKDKCNKLQNQVNILHRKLESIKNSDKAQLHEIIERLEEENKALREENNNLRREFEQLKDIIGGYKNQLEKTQQQANDAQQKAGETHQMMTNFMTFITMMNPAINLVDYSKFNLSQFSSASPCLSSKVPVLNPDFLKYMFMAPPAKSDEVTQSQAESTMENLDESIQPSPP